MNYWQAVRTYIRGEGWQRGRIIGSLGRTFTIRLTDGRIVTRSERGFQVCR